MISSRLRLIVFMLSLNKKFRTPPWHWCSFNSLHPGQPPSRTTLTHKCNVQKRGQTEGLDPDVSPDSTTNVRGTDRATTTGRSVTTTGWRGRGSYRGHSGRHSSSTRGNRSWGGTGNFHSQRRMNRDRTLPAQDFLNPVWNRPTKTDNLQEPYK